MKIIVKQNEQQPEITIDFTGIYRPFAIRDAIGLALEIDGYTKETIREVFGLMPDCVAEQVDKK